MNFFSQMSKPKKNIMQIPECTETTPYKEKFKHELLLSARTGVMISVNTGVPIKEMDKLNLYKIWGISSSCYMFLSVHETLIKNQ